MLKDLAWLAGCAVGFLVGAAVVVLLAKGC